MQSCFRVTRWCVVLTAVCLWLVPTASADDTIRMTWVHEKGQFTNTKGIFWRETHNEKIVYYFVEVGRNQDFIELYDDSREFTLRLYKSKAILKQGKDAEWADLFAGKWDK